MPDSSSLLLSPLLSLVAVAVIALICRWVFSTSNRTATAPQPPRQEDLGLLVPVAAVRTREDAQMLRDVLTDAGVRAGISEGNEEFRVLVFRPDLDLARQLVNAV